MLYNYATDSFDVFKLGVTKALKFMKENPQFVRDYYADILDYYSTKESLKIIRYVCELDDKNIKMGPLTFKIMMDNATLKNNLRVTKYLLDTFKNIRNTIIYNYLYDCAYYNQRVMYNIVFDYVKNFKSGITEDLLSELIRRKWNKEFFNVINHKTVTDINYIHLTQIAARHNNFEVVKYFIDNKEKYKITNVNTAFIHATSNSYYDITKYLLPHVEHDYIFDVSHVQALVKYKKYLIYKYNLAAALNISPIELDTFINVVVSETYEDEM